MKNWLILLLLLPLAVAGKVPDETDILGKVLDASSPYYYANLMLRYQTGDQTLSDEDYHYLYYGYAYQEDYKPLADNPDRDRALLLFQAAVNDGQPTGEQLQEVISAVNDAMRLDPFSPKMLNILAYAYGKSGNRREEQVHFNKMNCILVTIEETGDGLREGTPWHILMFEHGLDLLAAKGWYYGKGRVVSRSVEYVPLLDPVQLEDGKKVKGCYFDYSRIYRNKPEGYVFKRPRTWQFNNLKPREYK